MILKELLEVIDDASDIMVWARSSEKDDQEVLVSSNSSRNERFDNSEVDYVKAYMNDGIDIGLKDVVSPYENYGQDYLSED